MIPFEVPQESTPLRVGSTAKNVEKTSEGVSSFAELLNGVTEQSAEENKILNGAVVLSLEEQTKATTSSNKKSLSTALESLLSGDITTDEIVNEEGEVTLNSKVLSSLDTEELKQLINDAKTYLKEQITQTDGYIRSEASLLPKTLKGLAQLAQKLDIDISDITIEDVQTKQSIEEMTAKQKKNLKTEEALSSKVKTEDGKLTQTGALTETKLKSEPLFQAQSKTDVSTQEFVSAKIQNQKPSASETKKIKADETLKLLLQGQSSMKNGDSSILTQDFSTATARVIAPQAITESEKSLDSLLQGESQESNTESVSKVDNNTKTLKADSFEVKLNEAKQMTKYLSQDVKTAIDNYKAPFTRIKVQLNPQNLGEIELTVVQRGKNLHVNLSSNNAAINALAMNANDLKVQLQNNGINNASLNFSNNAQGGESSNSGQAQQQQHNQNKHDEYNYFESEERNEELISSLEIVVPNYA